MNETHHVKLNGVHAFVFSVTENGQKITLSGWDYDRRRFKSGDYLIIENKDGATTRYKVDAADFPNDPPDQYFLQCSFNPRRRYES